MVSRLEFSTASQVPPPPPTLRALCGENTSNGLTVYSLMRRDLGYAFKSPYTIGDPPKRTSKWLLAERATSKKHIPLKFVSNSTPTEEEWDDLVKQDSGAGQRPLLRLDIKEGQDRLREART